MSARYRSVDITRPDGSDLHPHTDVSERFAELVEALDLPPIRLPDLRHSAASAMLHAGVDLTVVSRAGALRGSGSPRISTRAFTRRFRPLLRRRRRR